MRLTSFFIGILFTFHFATGQPKPTLTVADTLPASIYQYIQQSPYIKSKLNSLSGKWIILDIMSTKCYGCILELPRFNLLQKKYKDKVQILLVTPQQKDYVKEFEKRNQIFKASGLPVLTDDTVLVSLFPHLFIPHEVWIDPKGVIRAITTSEFVNSRNIEWALSAKLLTLPLKLDVEKEFYNGNQPLGGTQQKGFYATLLPYSKKFNRAFKVFTDSAKDITRLSIVNYPIIDIFRHCIGRPNHKPSQTILHIADTQAIVFNSASDYWAEWEQKYTYSYEATHPAGTSLESIKRKLKADIEASFCLNSSFEKRVVECYVLKETGSHTSRIANTVSVEDSLAVSDIVHLLNEKYFSLPVVDERKSKSGIMVKIQKSALSNIDGLRKQLAYHGLEMVKEMREMMILTISDDKN